MDHKSTSGGCHLLGCSLVSWSSKKQNYVALSTAEAEYIAACACCAQILYMKHIDIRHHFLRDHEAKGDISLQGVRSEEQLADIFTKPLDESTFVRLRNELNVLDAANVM